MVTNIYDSHTHSDNSVDAHHSVMFMCEQALESGVAGICVTDHCELRLYEEEQYAQRIEQCAFDVSKASRVFNGRFTVLLGIELSDVLYNGQLTDQVIAAHDFDMILVSQHNNAENQDIYYCDFKKWSPREIDDYLNWYFSYLVRVTEWDKYDVMAHLTYPIRYITGANKIKVDLRKYADHIETLLKNVALHGKAIEINTSGLWQALGDTMPPFDIVKRYKELGGEYITVGSDAHSAESIGRGIRSGLAILAEAGFTYFTLYKQRQPLQFPLE